ncbi:M56 family metallopeptidase [Williamsia sp.]|uniref:M56 family metallopeptidase n=1 Tax=Williamsia sp. TaxID=1872085 RepID=UPI002F956F65
MILAATLALAAALIGIITPRVLLALPQAASPRLLMVGWLASMAAFGFLLFSAAVVVAWPDHAPAEGLADLWIRCLSSAQHSMEPWVTQIAVGISAVSAAFALGRITSIGRQQHRSRAKVRGYHDDILTVIARTTRDPGSSYPVLWLDHPLPFAYSIAGNPGLVVATEGLNTCLTPTEAVAVLEHERAHLHGRHHRILAISALLSRTMPKVPLLARAPAVLAMLAELDADRVAARTTSPAIVHSALRRVLDQQDGGHTAHHFSHCAADVEATNTRRLDVLAAHTFAPTRRLTYAAAAVLPIAGAALTATLTMTVLSALYCVVLT